VSINGAIFAILYSPLESLGPIRLHCEEWSLVLLAPIKSQTNIVISAINVICLNEIVSEQGNVNLHASNRLVKFTRPASEHVSEFGEDGMCQFDDAGALLYYHRLFNDVVNCIRNGHPGSIPEAQQKWIMGLCLLADKIEDKPDNLDLHQVLNIWKIPKPL
jgi:hypothetical protein